MKRTSWKIALACCIAITFSSADVFARGFAGGAGISHGGGGGHPGGGGGARPGGAGGGGGRPPGGGAPHAAAAAPAARAPAGGGGGRQFSGGGGGPRPGVRPAGGATVAAQRPAGGHAPAISRTPSFSHPNYSARTAGLAPQAAVRPEAGIRPSAGIRPATGLHAGPATGARQAGGPTVGARPPVGGGRLGGGAAGAIAHPGAIAGAGRRFEGSNRAGITSRPYAGNALNYGNHSFNLANSGYRPSFYGHGLYHGYWNGNYGFGGGYGGGWGGYGPGWGYGGGWGYGPGYGLGLGLGLGLGYGLAPLGWGYGGWGLGGLAYNSGYLGYSNPYYNSSFAGYNYSQPIAVDYSAAPAAVAAEGNPADAALNAAVAAFKQNDYDAALDIINKGIAQYPTDAVMHEFRALVLFAKGDYQQAAATIHSVLAIGPGWDWTTLASIYPNVVIYSDQLRELEVFVREHPQDAAARFLLAYQYTSGGHPDAAARQLQQVVTIMPGDRVAADLLKMLSAPPAATAEQPSPQPAAETQPTATPIDETTLIGSFHAARADDSKFELTLTNNATFTWKFSSKQQPPQAFSGTYTVEGNVLALERKDGGSLIGEVIPGGAKKFNFRLVGAPPEDKGLDFSG